MDHKMLIEKLEKYGIKYQYIDWFKSYLNSKFLLMKYFPFIHSYINYGNVAWTSTSQTKLKKIPTKQKHAVRIIFHAEKEAHIRPLLKEIHALNVYQINILKMLTFMEKVKIATIPRIFLNAFKEIEYKYPPCL